MGFGVVIDRFLRQQLLPFVPQVDRNQLLFYKMSLIRVLLLNRTFNGRFA